MVVKAGQGIEQAEAERPQITEDITAALKSKIQAIAIVVADARTHINWTYAQARAERRNLSPNETGELDALARAVEALEVEYHQLKEDIWAALKSDNTVVVVHTNNDYFRVIMNDVATQGRLLSRFLAAPAQNRSVPMEPPLSRTRQAVHKHDGRKANPATRLWTPPTAAAIKTLRMRLGFSQAGFAARYGLNLRALQNWEQERCEPELTAVVLLAMIDRAPETVATIIDKIWTKKPGSG